MKRFSLFALSSLIAAGILVSPARSGSTPPQSTFKNIKVLTGMSDADITKAMQSYTKALGENCAYCHQGTDYVSEENPKKEIARKMITMVKTINGKDFLNGKAECMLCHRGLAIPDASQ